MASVSDDNRGAKGVLNLIQHSIQTSDEDTLTDILDAILFNEMDFQSAVDLLIGLLKMCSESDEAKMAKIIYDKNEMFYPNTSDVQFIIYLILNRRSTSRLLNFLFEEVVPEYNLGEIIYQLCNTQNQDLSQMKLAIDKCWEIFETSNLQDLNSLYDFALRANTIVATALASKIRKINNYAKVPAWIISPKILPREYNIIIPSITDLKIGLPANENLIDIMLENINEELKSQMNCEEDDSNIISIRERLLMKFNALSLSDKYEIAKDFIEKRNMLALQNDLSLFITLGPSAPLADSQLDELDYGGARMFTFNNFDTDPDIEDDDVFPDGTPKNIVNWFVGYCQECNLRILRRYHAVRLPMLFGGWKGCFCSWKCVRNNINENNNDDTYSSNENSIMLQLVDIYEDQINTYKILDRIPDEQYNIYLTQILNDNKEVIEDNLQTNFYESGVPSIENYNREETVNNSINVAVDMSISPEEIKIEESPIVLHYFYSNECDICKRLRPQLYQFVEYSSTVNEVGHYVKTTSINEINVDEVDISQTGVSEVPTVVMINRDIPIRIFTGSNIIRPIALKLAELNM